jgi:hypothetical protein
MYALIGAFVAVGIACRGRSTAAPFGALGEAVASAAAAAAGAAGAAADAGAGAGRTAPEPPTSVCFPDERKIPPPTALGRAESRAFLAC